MKAWVKNGNLPDAPKPTLPSHAEDPRDRERREHYLRQFSRGEVKFMNHTEYVEKKKKIGRPSIWNARRKEITVQMWNEGKSIKEISRAIGITFEGTKFRIAEMQKNGEIEARKHTPSEEEKEEIRKLYKRGMTQGQIAEEFGVSRSTVNRIIRRRKS